jgi:hypothetical protein
MDLKSRRKLRKTTLPESMGEVFSDGRTVWVNLDFCVARFCPVSREYAAVDSEGNINLSAHPEASISHPETGPTTNDWIDFVNEVNSRWGIVIDQEHTPLYIQ